MYPSTFSTCTIATTVLAVRLSRATSRRNACRVPQTTSRILAKHHRPDQLQGGGKSPGLGYPWWVLPGGHISARRIAGWRVRIDLVPACPQQSRSARRCRGDGARTAIRGHYGPGLGRPTAYRRARLPPIGPDAPKCGAAACYSTAGYPARAAATRNAAAARGCPRTAHICRLHRQDALHSTELLYGHILNELQEVIERPEETDDVLRLGLHRLAITEFPRLRELAPALASYDGAAELDRFLDLLLPGMTAILTGRDGQPASV